MPNKYQYTKLERATQIIEWDGGSDFKGQLEAIAKYCGWDAISAYAAEKAAQPSVQEHKPWTCSVCGYKNNGFRKRCGGCMADYDEQGRGI